MVAIADIGLRERSFDKLGLMGLKILESPEFISEWNAFVENIGRFFSRTTTSIVLIPTGTVYKIYENLTRKKYFT